MKSIIGNWVIGILIIFLAACNRSPATTASDESITTDSTVDEKPANPIPKNDAIIPQKVAAEPVSEKQAARNDSEKLEKEADSDHHDKDGKVEEEDDDDDGDGDNDKADDDDNIGDDRI